MFNVFIIIIILLNYFSFILFYTKIKEYLILRSVCGRLGEQLINKFERNRDGKFENICLDDNSRPTSLIRRYDNIYSDERVELLDVLELSGQGHGVFEQERAAVDTESCQQPEQLLVSIIVVSWINNNS